MFPRQMSCAAIVAAVVMNLSVANAQFYDGCSSCGPVTAPMAVCTPIQPVQTTCYQTVPVTTYQREEQTVKVPYYETNYEEREFTVMRPVTSQREVEVPTVTYQNVTEYHTVNRDMGRWVTRYQPVQKCSPCQVDPRPGLIGWLNRTGYSFRTAFRPNYTTSREYIPNMMSCSVPVTRQVAVRGTRRVTLNETQMVAERKTERVPVQRLAWREETRTVMRPQTAYRTVPIGTQLAYGYGAYGGYGGVTAFAPIIDNSRTALGPVPDPISANPRSADNRKMFSEDETERYDRARAAEEEERFRRSSHSLPLERTPPKQTSPEDSRTLEPVNELPNFGTSNDRPAPVVIPAALRRIHASESDSPSNAAPATGWKRTTPRTAMRSSQTTSSGSQVTLTENTEP